MSDNKEQRPGLPSINVEERHTKVSKAVGAGILGAGSALVGAFNPILGVIAGGLTPFVQTAIEDLVMLRATRLRAHLDANGVNLEDLSEDGTKLSTEKIRLLQEAIAAALGTDTDGKVQVIVRLLKIGLDAEVETDVLAAQRFARTVSRLDEVELRVILALESIRNGNDKKASLPAITSRSVLGNADLVRSALASLEGEGLVKMLPGALETWTISDFGRRLVAELAAVFHQDEGAGTV